MFRIDRGVSVIYQYHCSINIVQKHRSVESINNMQKYKITCFQLIERTDFFKFLRL